MHLPSSQQSSFQHWQSAFQLLPFHQELVSMFGRAEADYHQARQESPCGLQIKPSFPDKT
jgi:hypothetical protein